MSLVALFMSICIHTTLPCDQVEVRYSNMESPKQGMWSGPTVRANVLGRASVYSTGRQVIEINSIMKNYDEWRVRNVMLHEISHLVVWQEYPNQQVMPHGRKFRNACYKVSRAASLRQDPCREGF